MTVEQVIDLAKSGELYNLGEKDNSVILNYINLGLIELYKRFRLETKEYIITLQEDVEMYDLPSDLMWIIEAYGEVPENSTEMVSVLPINEEDNPLSINTASWNKVQVPLTIDGEYVSIIYVASPVYLTTDNLADVTPIPTQMVETLLHYVGYRAHAAMNGEIQAEHNTHYQRFEASCNKLLQQGMITSDDLSSINNLRNKGFV